MRQYSGQAAEHLVCADIIMKGYIAFLTAPSMPYDVAAEINGKIVRIQVKSTEKLKLFERKGYKHPAYLFDNGKSDHTKFDLYAFYCPTDNVIGYLTAKEIGSPNETYLMPIGTPTSPQRKRETIDHFTLQRALELL